ncbi:conserved hypothetical protein [Candidatus Zixiibacteriota bacterium]|nr:conserved hypothetical protein [candidate division Zixibacteria bacterium]
MKRTGKFKAGEIIGPRERGSMNYTSLGFGGSGPGNLVWRAEDFRPGRFRLELYRFLRDNIPLLHACIWTWSRLSSAPGRFEIIEPASQAQEKRGVQILEELSQRIYPYQYHKMGGLESFLPLFFSSLFTDGAFAGFIVIQPDLSGVERFLPIDPSYITADDNQNLYLETEKGSFKLEGDDFYYFGLNSDIKSGQGKSILSSVPFVAHIEQQLVDDMRRASHNAGYHRLHVKITPPDKLSGESDDAYVNRVNEYFDDTVDMIKGCEPEDNPVTWDNVKIEYIGPSGTAASGNAWFLNHRAMIEEICAGTNLSPFMLGFSYGTTHNWAQFKFDLVMRQVISVQRQAARFLEWLGNIELGLKGLSCRCRYNFDNTLSYLASDRAEIERTRVENIIKLHTAGLVTREKAEEAVSRLV